MRTDIQFKIRKLLNKVLVNDTIYTEQTPILGRNGILDSLTAFQFICEVEDLFSVQIIENDLNLDCLENIETLSEYIIRNGCVM